MVAAGVLFAGTSPVCSAPPEPDADTELMETALSTVPTEGQAGNELLLPVPAPPEAPQLEAGLPVQPVPDVRAAASVISLAPGEIATLSVKQVQRLAIGNPQVADVTVVSPVQLLIQAKAAGKTNLIVWDQQGQHPTTIEVIDRSAETAESQLRELIASLKLSGVQVSREDAKLFLVGEVQSQGDLDRLERMLSAFTDVTNLVRVSDTAPEAAEMPMPELVKLAVQVLEINRSDLERLGVKWSDSVGLTEPKVEDLTGTTALTRFGTSLTRSAFGPTLNALVQQNRARVLAEPRLVTSAGKEASSFIGVEVPYVTATSLGTTTASASTSIEYRETGVLLKMTPTVIGKEPNRRITTIITAELSDVDTSVALTVPVGSQTVVVPGFKVRKASTEVTTVSGESIFIAGLLQVEESITDSHVPALGSVPILGRLFRLPETKAILKEIIIVVTPELIADQGATTQRGYLLEQALSIAEVRPPVENPLLGYATQVQERIAKAITYPGRERELGISGQVKLRVHLFRDGTLGRALVAESSGIESFDLEALKAAEIQAPYPPFPSALNQPDLWLELPVQFRP